MHRTPGRDACRRTKTLEGCQPFERVTSAFLLPSSYRIFLLASLPPESGRDRGREISAGSLPSSRDAELFRVVNSERYDARPSFVEPALYSPPPNFLVSRILAGLSRAGKIGASCVTVADYSFQLRAAPTWPNFHPARAISLLLDWPSPNSPSFEETPQLSSPFSSKAIDRDKEPQTLPCRRCEFLPLVPPWPKFTVVFADLSRVARLKSTVGRICRERWDRGQQKAGLAIPGLAIIATSSRGLAIYH